MLHLPAEAHSGPIQTSKDDVFARIVYVFKSTLLTVLSSVVSVQIRSFFWSIFSRPRTEHGDLPSKSPYLTRVWENMDKKKLRIWTIFTQYFFAENFIVYVGRVLITPLTYSNAEN